MTIVVLIILVAVTINVAINGGLIGNSKTASKKYTKEQYKEILQTSISDANIEYYKENDFIITDKSVMINKEISDKIEKVAIAGELVKVDDYIFEMDTKTAQVTERTDLNEVEWENIVEEINKSSGSSEGATARLASTEIKGLGIANNTKTTENITVGEINSIIEESDGQYIYFPKGTYNLTGPIKIINRHDLYIKLDNEAILNFSTDQLGTSGIYEPNESANIYISGSTNIIIDGGKITDNETEKNLEYAGGTSSIYVTESSSNILIQNMEIYEGRCAGIYVGARGGSAGSTAVTEGICINNVIVRDNYNGQGVVLTSAQNVNISNCTLENIWARNRP